jgi:hypothetical protein
MNLTIVGGRVPSMAWLGQEPGLARVYEEGRFVIYRVR